MSNATDHPSRWLLPVALSYTDNVSSESTHIEPADPPRYEWQFVDEDLSTVADVNALPNFAVLQRGAAGRGHRVALVGQVKRTPGAPAEAKPPPELLIQLKATVNAGQHLLRLAETVGMSAADILVMLTTVWAAPPPGSDDPTHHLSAGEVEALRRSGALTAPMPPPADRASTRTAIDTARLTVAALTVDETAELIGRSAGRIRQRLGEGTLLGFRDGRSWRIPRFQFENGADGLSELPGWDQVMAALPRTVHPLTVKHFLDTPSPELVFDDDTSTPRDWLLGSGNIDAVVELAAELHQMP